MGLYIGQENNLIVLIARYLIDKSLFGININTFIKKDISKFTLDYYKSIWKDIIEFSIIIVMPSNTLNVSIFKDDIFIYSMIIFIEKEIIFNLIYYILVLKHYLASSLEL